MKRIALMLVLLIAIVGCGLKTMFPSITAIPEDATLVTWAEAGVKAVTVLRGAAKLAFTFGCGTGVIESDICTMYKTADAAAESALASASTALVNYKADPTSENAGLLEVAKTALMEAWNAFNVVNGKTSFISTRVETMDPIGLLFDGTANPISRLDTPWIILAIHSES